MDAKDAEHITFNITYSKNKTDLDAFLWELCKAMYRVMQ